MGSDCFDNAIKKIQLFWIFFPMCGRVALISKTRIFCSDRPKRGEGHGSEMLTNAVVDAPGQGVLVDGGGRPAMGDPHDAGRRRGVRWDLMMST